MRATKVVLLAVALGMTIGGGILLWKGLDSDGPERMGLIIAGATVLVVGLSMFVAARYVAGLDTSPLLRNGIPGTAQVLYTQDTGVTVSNVNLVVRVGLRVSVPGQPTYDAESRWVAQGRQQWGALQPGMTVAVRVDPTDPRQVAIDTSHPAVPISGMPMPGMAQGTPIPGMPLSAMSAPLTGVPTGPGPQIVTRSAADVIAAGVKVDGRLLQVAATGIVAGQVAGGLPADQADDAIVHVAFTYSGPYGEQQCQTLVRVPDGKARYLVTGAPIPVAVLAHDPTSATIDWSRLP
jgi:hypothetical protein